MPLYEIEKQNDGRYKIWVYDPRLAGRTNRSLKTYPIETDFVAEGSEGIFYALESQYKHVLAILKS
jgi:hypothetical protein